MRDLDASMLSLVIETATNMPCDVRRVVAEWREKESSRTLSGQALAIICANIDMAREMRAPICQDTGMPTFWVRCPRDTDQSAIALAIRNAAATATAMGALRPNSVDSVTGANSGNNLGPGTPVVHFEQHEERAVEVMLLLKGGGCENQSTQYSVPCELEGLGRADRDLDGVYKCIMHALYKAQGHGCSAGFIGVCVGGDRSEGYADAKRQLLRPIDDCSESQELRRLEERVMAGADSLGIGTMGFGGKVTLLGCKIGALNRLPASFFVSVAYNCWAYRRLGVRLDLRTGEIVEWRFRAAKPDDLAAGGWRLPAEPARTLQTPLSEADVRQLRVGDLVLVNGMVHTGRDGMHKYLMANDPPVPLEGGLIYHCGPVMVQDDKGVWNVRSAGPTTSIREEPYQADVLRRTGVRAVCGKGGMGPRTLQALSDVGAVYLNAIGGAAAYYASTVQRVHGVDLLDKLGMPEAMWHLEVKDFPAVVTMDAHGRSLHEEVRVQSLERLGELRSA